MEIYLSRHFRLSQFICSTAAKNNSIDNTPKIEHIVALTCLVSFVLQPLKFAIGQNIYILSGYRSHALNNVLGGHSENPYTRGECAMIRIESDITEIHRCLVMNGIPFDNCILHVKSQSAELSYKRTGGNAHRIIYQ